MSGPLDDLGFEPYDGPLGDLGFEPYDATSALPKEMGAQVAPSAGPPTVPQAPAPEPPQSALDWLATSAGGMEPGGGRDYQDPRIQKAQMAAAGPSLWEAAKVIAPMALPGGAGLGAVGRVALNAANGAGTEGAISAIEDDRWRSDPKAAAMTALERAKSGARHGAIFGLGGEALGWLATKGGDVAANVAEWAGRSAARNRVASAGATGAQMRNLADNRGDEYVQQLGDRMEREGLHRGSGLLGFLPQPAETILENAQGLSRSSGRGMAEGEAAIRAHGDPIGDVTPVMDRLNQEAATRGASWDPANGPQEAFAREYADRIGSMPGVGHITGEDGAVEGLAAPLSEMLRQKRDAYENINFARRGGTEAGPYQEALRRDVAGILNREGNASMDAAVSRGELPQELVSDWRTNNENFGTAQDVVDFAHGRTWRDQGNMPVSFPGWLAGSSGGLPAMALAHGVKTRGRSAMAGMGRGIESGADMASDGLADFSGALRSNSPGAVAAGASTFDPGSAAQASRQEAMTWLGQSRSDRSAAARETMNEGKGQHLETVVLQTLQSNPQALGQYRSQLEEAQASEDPMKLTAALNQLNQDPQFRASVGRQLMAATGDMR
jgi:hypothetical protein